MDGRQQAAAILEMAQRYKHEARSKQRNVRVLMEAFNKLCQREGIDPAEMKRMQGTAEGTPWPKQQLNQSSP